MCDSEYALLAAVTSRLYFLLPLPRFLARGKGREQGPEKPGPELTGSLASELSPVLIGLLAFLDELSLRSSVTDHGGDCDVHFHFHMFDSVLEKRFVCFLTCLLVTG